MIAQIDSIRYLCRQGLGLRNKEETEGNLYQLLRLRAGENQNIKNWLSSGKYMSHDIISEIIEIMARYILTHIIERIRKNEYFSIILDGTRDISGIEQFSFCIRTVNTDFSINEDFLGLYALPQTSAAVMFDVICDILIRYGIDKEKSRGQSYDGASAMSGDISGVATRFQSFFEEAIFIHCYSHKLNLVLHDLVKNVRIISEVQDFVKELYNFIMLAPKRLATFQRIQDQLIYDEDNNSTYFESLKKLCPTRFTSRTSAYRAIFTNYKPLKEVDSFSYEKGETGAK